MRGRSRHQMGSTSPFGLSHIQIRMHRHGRVGRKDYDLATQNTEPKIIFGYFPQSDLELKTITASFQPLAFNSHFLLSTLGLPPKSHLIIISCLCVTLTLPTPLQKREAVIWIRGKPAHPYVYVPYWYMKKFVQPSKQDVIIWMFLPCFRNAT